MAKPETEGDFVRLTLNEAATHLLEECRMVLPGIQALFGFQLVAVFSAGFKTDLTFRERCVHLVAIACTVVSIALVMAPAALHRRREPTAVSRGFLDVSSRFLMWGMVPLAVGTTLDVYLVARVIAGVAVAWMSATAALSLFVTAWAVIPSRIRL